MSFIIVPPAATGVTFPIVGTPDATIQGLPVAAGNVGGASILEGGNGGLVKAAKITTFGGDDTGFAAGGGVAIAGGVGGPSGSGGTVDIAAGGAFGGANNTAGNVQITSGDVGGGGIATPGNIVLTVGSNGVTSGVVSFNSTLGQIAALPNAQVVNIAGTGPGAAAVTVTKWLPVTVDGVNGFLPFFT